MSLDQFEGGDANRVRIVSIVDADPGITKSELKFDLNLSWGTIDYHLHLLRDCQAVKFHRVYPRLHLFSPEVPDYAIPMLSALRLSRSEEIVSQLDSPLRAQDLVESMSASRKVIDRHLAHLILGGVLERDGFRYSPSNLYKRFFGGK